MQLTAHLPEAHACPAAHAVAHLPQLAVSLEVSTQVPPHEVWPPAQVAVMQVPATQGAPPAQLLPQAPQSAVFEVVSVHWPLHCRWPLGQLA